MKPCEGAVVICLKISTFVVSKTTHNILVLGSNTL